MSENKSFYKNKETIIKDLYLKLLEIPNIEGNITIYYYIFYKLICIKNLKDLKESTRDIPNYKHLTKIKYELLIDCLGLIGYYKQEYFED